ncbi:hypothetical protein Hanom_Chr01g00023221 [Helianthus anomalus]
MYTSVLQLVFQFQFIVIYVRSAPIDGSFLVLSMNLTAAMRKMTDRSVLLMICHFCASVGVWFLLIVIC